MRAAQTRGIANPATAVSASRSFGRLRRFILSDVKDIVGQRPEYFADWIARTKVDPSFEFDRGAGESHDLNALRRVIWRPNAGRNRFTRSKIDSADSVTCLALDKSLLWVLACKTVHRRDEIPFPGVLEVNPSIPIDSSAGPRFGPVWTKPGRGEASRRSRLLLVSPCESDSDGKESYESPAFH